MLSHDILNILSGIHTEDVIKDLLPIRTHYTYCQTSKKDANIYDQSGHTTHFVRRPQIMQIFTTNQDILHKASSRQMDNVRIYGQSGQTQRRYKDLRPIPTHFTYRQTDKDTNVKIHG